MSDTATVKAVQERIIGTLDYHGTVSYLVRSAVISLANQRIDDFVSAVETIIWALYPLDADNKTTWQKLWNKYNELMVEARKEAERELVELKNYVTDGAYDRQLNRVTMEKFVTKLKPFFFMVVLETIRKDFKILIKKKPIPR